MPGLLLFYRCMMGRCKIFPFFLQIPIDRYGPACYNYTILPDW